MPPGMRLFATCRAQSLACVAAEVGWWGLESADLKPIAGDIQNDLIRFDIPAEAGLLERLVGMTMGVGWS